MGGHQISDQGPRDDGFNEEGYDESQRAEILEVTRDGPSDGTLLTDIAPDLGDDTDEEEDALGELEDGDVGEEDGDAELDDDDLDEDELQADFDEDELDDDDDLDDADKVALEP